MKPTADAQPLADAYDVDLARRVLLLLGANRTGFRRITVWAEERTVSLSGSVRSFFDRQSAVALAKQVVGVRRVVDNLVVDPGELGNGSVESNRKGDVPAERASGCNETHQQR